MAITKAPEGVQFEIHCTGSETGKTWDGKFRAKPLLNFRDQMGADKYRREMLGPGSEAAAPEVIATAVVLAELTFRLTEAPEWWTNSKGGMELADPNVLEEIYRKAKDIESEYLKKVEDEGKAAADALRATKG